MPWGRGFGRGFGWYGMLGWPGNPYPFCRRFPWLPRGWWRMPYMMPYYPYSYYIPWTYPYYSYYWYPYWWYPYW